MVYPSGTAVPFGQESSSHVSVRNIRAGFSFRQISCISSPFSTILLALKCSMISLFLSVCLLSSSHVSGSCSGVHLLVLNLAFSGGSSGALHILQIHLKDTFCLLRLYSAGHITAFEVNPAVAAIT